MTVLTPPPAATPPSGSEPLLAVACPACHAALAAARAEAGTAARCPVCRIAFMLPLPPRREPAARDRGDAESNRADGVDPLRHDRDQKSIRRARRNILMLTAGAAILLAIVLLFGSRRPQKRR